MHIFTQTQSPNTDIQTNSTHDCQTDPIGHLKEMFVDDVQYGRIKRGQCPARRPVFLRLHGVAQGYFEIVPDLLPELQVGLFNPGETYPAWVRYSSDIPDGYPDFKSTVGLGVKLFNVPGKKVLSPDEDAPTADFLFQNMDVFFVDNAEDMCVFTRAVRTSIEARDAWLADHPKTKEILDAMKKAVPTVLGTNLWSVIPFHFGKEMYCKYKIEPELIPPGGEPNYNDPNYLQVDLEKRLAQGEARFRFLVQFQINDKTMPLDKATVRWPEAVSEPIHVATLVLPCQDITARGQSHYGETLSFNPWRTLEEHKPVGSIADVRKVVYTASAKLRRDVNGQPIGEPEEARPPMVWPTGKDSQIVSAKIHPAIGIARIGNSTAPGEEGYYIGPEVIEPESMKADEMRDSHGAIKRQAARFRVYGYNAAGEVMGELDPGTALIEWTVHLANKKAQWYQFQNALDIPEGQSVIRRNADVTGPVRTELAIDPGPRTIQCNPHKNQVERFDTGKFQNTPVPLGEMRTDENGHLLVLGGLGQSVSPTNQPVFNPTDDKSFNNANGWYDDTSDGPVTARVTIAGREIPVEPSWVVVAPPNYAPDVVSWNTLYDLLKDIYIQRGWLPLPETVSFTQDILPVLRRLSNLQWVNKGFAAMFGQGGPMNFEDPALIAKLALRPQPNGDDPYHELRQTLYNAFRHSGTLSGPGAWPWIYGDAMTLDITTDTSPRANVTMLEARAELLRRWVAGEFVNDWDPDAKSYRALDKVPLAQQPAMLDQAALHFCLADAFHPGCEMTWPMRHTTMYSAPFRIRHRDPNAPEPDYGRELTPKNVLQLDGPLYAQGPGDISRWMALPWQGDTAFCRSGYEAGYDPYLPTFWPARVPNQVLTEEDYARVMDESLPREERIAAFNTRLGWLRALKGGVAPQMEQMIREFGQMGIVEARPGIPDDPDFPETIWVESLSPEHASKLEDMQHRLMASGEHSLAWDPYQKAGWESAEQHEKFRRARMRSHE